MRSLISRSQAETSSLLEPPPGAVSGRDGVPSRLGPCLSSASACVDWITANWRGPSGAGAYQWVYDWAVGWWGEPEPVRGMFFHASGWRWATGAGLYYTRSEDGAEVRWTLRLSGGVCAELGLADQVQVIKELRRWECTFSRLDLAVDVRGLGLRLIELMTEAAEHGDYANVRLARPVREFVWRKGCRRLVGHGVYFGRRDGDAVMVRGYDKGLQTRTAPQGRWARVEAQFSGLRAESPALILAVCETAGSQADAVRELVAGAVDFVRRPPSGRLDRATRLGWWAEFLGRLAAVKTPAAARTFASLERWGRWFRRCVFPQVWRAAADTGRAVDEVLCVLGLLETPRAARPSVAVAQFVRCHPADTS